MKKYYLILAIMASCSKAAVRSDTNYVDNLNINRQDYFLPTFVSENQAAQLDTGAPLLLIHYCVHSDTPIFAIKENGIILQVINAVKGPEIDGYQLYTIPIDFLIPDVWSGKLIEISSSHNPDLITWYKVK